MDSDAPMGPSTLGGAIALGSGSAHFVPQQLQSKATIGMAATETSVWFSGTWVVVRTCTGVVQGVVLIRFAGCSIVKR